jgi:phage terminase small subunit
MSKGSKLTVKERNFIVAYTGEAKGNGTLAAKLAGYGGSNAILASLANENLRKPKIAAVVKTILDLKAQKGIAAAEERDAVLSALLRNPFLEPLARITAIKELNKCEGRHVMKLKVEGKLTLREALGISRELEEQAETEDR